MQNHKNSINNKSANNQKYTYLDPAKTTRLPNMTLKAFQKNAVQSYFERQQQQQQHQQQPQQPNSPDKESPKSAKIKSNQTTNGTTNGNINYDSPTKCAAITNGNGLSSNSPSVIRPQSLPVNKVCTSMESIPQTRLSLPNKLSQIINLTTQLAAQKQAMNGITNLTETNDRSKTPSSTPTKSPTKQPPPTVTIVDKNNLKSINESGVPPPPPRRSNRTVMPIRR